jgi:undecaprenyl-diphosphatase
VSRRSSIARDAIVAFLFALVFLWLASIVRNGALPPFDTALRDAIHGLASPPLTVFMQGITQLGNGWLIFPLSAILAYRLARQGRRREAALLILAAVGAKLLEQILKSQFHRLRPDPFFDYPRPGSYSFPSGHALLSCSFYPTIAWILPPQDWPRARTLAVRTFAILLTLCIGFTRVYLGVHYPTDVLGGYAGAIAWTSIVRAGLKVSVPAQAARRL